ncbi:condensation domain-containing protein [Streptomyces sp. NPDC057302]|uniref:condensation domain-containing protein n=1 Tax=Streptomyces sp. NPDC057302 TaxID=3346094 RepID=UPI00362F090A
MTTEHPPATSLTVILDPQSPALELFGPLETTALEAALDRIAARCPGPRRERPVLRAVDAAHHTLRIPRRAGTSAPYPAGFLADLLTGTPPPPGSDPASDPVRDDPAAAPRHSADAAPAHGPPTRPTALTPLQRELLADAVTHPARHIEQLSWRWHGPLDTRRFTAAWQSVFDHETVLRTAFVWDPHPRAVLFDRSAPQVVRHPCGSVPTGADDAHHTELTRLMDHARDRGFDLRRPALLRCDLLAGEPQDTGCPPPTDVVLTYHRALLDNWSVRVLLQEFYRAYLAGGALFGGERRPDLRDYTSWLGGQDPSAARHLWSAGPRRPPAALPRARPGEATGRAGTGRSRARLTCQETAGLVEWAARWGTTESSALQAVWAMLLYRASAAPPDPAPVGFGVSVSGRGIPLEGSARIPGPFAHALPMVVEVDPASTVPRLLRSLRDRTLDMTSYEWVSAGQIHQWLGTAAGTEPAQTLLVFEHRLRHVKGLAPALAAQGVHVEEPCPLAGQGAFPIGVLAHHAGDGALVLTSVHDRARIEDDKAAAMLAQSARLLRQLPHTAGEQTTVAEVLTTLDDMDVPRLHGLPEQLGDAPGPLVPLRAALAPGAGTVCLITPPGAPGGCHSGLAGLYGGPQALASIRPTADNAEQYARVLRALLDAGDPLVLGGFSGAGAIAYEIARQIAAGGVKPPLVVLGPSCADGCHGAGQGGVRDLARTIEAAARSCRRPLSGGSGPAPA